MNYHEVLSLLSCRYERGEARAIARLVFDSRFHLSWADVLCGGVETLGDRDRMELEEIVNRLAGGEPVQYVLGEAEFCGRMFHVEPGVLIPRIETEELVAQALKAMAGMPSPLRLLDIGTGSGCIAVSLDKALEDRQNDYIVDAVDVSDDALRIASHNAGALSAHHTNFIKADILCHEQASTLPGGYAAIVSNPPYICNKERAKMDSHVLDHEPAVALFVPDDDPLLFYKAITRFATGHLRPGGCLLFEINRAYGDETADMMRRSGFESVEVMTDQFGNDRIVKGFLNKGLAQ